MNDRMELYCFAYARVGVFFLFYIEKVAVVYRSSCILNARTRGQLYRMEVSEGTIRNTHKFRDPLFIYWMVLMDHAKEWI